MSDAISVTTRVAVDPATAFEIFTEEIDLWWRRGPRFRFLTEAEGALRFEPGTDGRLVEIGADGDEFEVGRVQVWEPAQRLVFDFRARAFEPGQSTEVEVRFEAEGDGTRVSVEHRGWDALAPEHPVRHGLDATAFGSMMGVWWADLLVSVRWQTERHAPGG